MILKKISDPTAAPPPPPPTKNSWLRAWSIMLSFFYSFSDSRMHWVELIQKPLSKIAQLGEREPINKIWHSGLPFVGSIPDKVTFICFVWIAIFYFISSESRTRSLYFIHENTSQEIKNV